MHACTTCSDRAIDGIRPEHRLYGLINRLIYVDLVHMHARTTCSGHMHACSFNLIQSYHGRADRYPKAMYATTTADIRDGYVQLCALLIPHAHTRTEVE
jgi:hypothetical protein